MNILFILLLFSGTNEICEKFSGFQNLMVYMEKNEAKKIFKEIIEEGIYNLRMPKNPDYKLLKSLIELKKTDLGSPFFSENLNKCLINCRSSIKREPLLILYLLKGNHSEQMEGIEKLEKLLNQI